MDYPLTLETALAVYDVLIEECGASDKGRDRDAFIYTQTKKPICVEWRFCGKLGFGGKFWNNSKFYISCYSENETAERLAMINAANARLTELYQKHLAEHPPA